MSDALGERGLLLMRAGAHAVAVYAAEAEGVFEWREPAPLPHAPAAVLGVVSLRGRMRTVLDPAALLAPPRPADESPLDACRLVVLRGDEQLALAVAHVETVLAPADLSPPAAPAPFLRAALRHRGHLVHLLDPAHLFAAAAQGAERRRQRQGETRES